MEKEDFKRESALASVGCKLRTPHGQWVEVTEAREEDDCEGCLLWVGDAGVYGIGCGDACCVPSNREDGKSVIFRKTIVTGKEKNEQMLL